MRHPFLHGLSNEPAAEASAGPVAESTSGRRSFFFRVGAAAAGLMAFLSGRRSEAQAPTTQALGEEGGGVGPGPSTRALGEEGRTSPSVTTYAIGEEGSGNATTFALGEEGGGNVSTYALGEEGTSRPVTTYALYEEGGSWQYRRPQRFRATTFAVGEEGSTRFYYRSR